jgi:Phytanoyl-CoA dioxygenase (PhyH)
MPSIESTAARIAEVREQGYCVLKSHFPSPWIDACREAFWPRLVAYVETHRETPNRGQHRHFLPMPFEPPCFHPGFFFDAEVLSIARGLMDDRIVADQWGCDVPLRGSDYQELHVDYQRPLFAEAPELPLPPYVLVVNFGLTRIGCEDGPIEIAPGTHVMPRGAALRKVKAAELGMQSVPLEIGDVLIRHPWAWHRGSPNTTHTPRALATVRYARRWYSDESRDVGVIPRGLWGSLMPEQQRLLRFPIGP